MAATDFTLQTMIGLVVNESRRKPQGRLGRNIDCHTTAFHPPSDPGFEGRGLA
jgi:hypothetical protein